MGGSDVGVAICVVDAPILGSEEDVFSAIVMVSLCWVLAVEDVAVAIWAGGYFVKNLSRRGCNC